jgi:hypothetical protein
VSSGASVATALRAPGIDRRGGVVLASHAVCVAEEQTRGIHLGQVRRAEVSIHRCAATRAAGASLSRAPYRRG